MALATLSIDLEARLASFEAGMEKAARIAEKNAEASRAAWSRAAAGIGALGGALVGGIAAFDFAGKLRASIDALDQLNDVADATGASIENISALDDVARRTGTSIDTVSSALIKFNRELLDTKPDSPTALALKQIGVNAEELRRQDPAEALLKTAQALATWADDGDKARITQELFGKSVKEIAPFLKDLAEKGQLNATVTAAQAAEAEKFNKQLFEMQANSDAAMRSLATGLLPVLNKLLIEVRAGTEVFGGFGAALLAIGTSDPFKNLGDRTQGLAKLKQELKSLQDAADDPGFFFNAARNKRNQASVQAQIDEQEKLIAYYKRVQSATVPEASYSNEGRMPSGDSRPSIGPLRTVEKLDEGRADKISQAQHALAKYVAELQRELDKSIEITEQTKALNLLKELGTLGEVPQVRELVLGMERQVTLLKQDAAIRADITKNIEAEAKAQQDLDEAIYRYSGRLEEARKIAETSRLEAQLAAGVEYSPVELERIVKGIAGIKDETKQQLDEMDVMFEQFGRNIQDALGDTIERTLRGDFDNIFKLWSDLLLKMAAQAGAAQLGKAIFGDGFSKGGGGEMGGLVGDFFKWLKPGVASANGNVFGSSGVMAFAAGGIVDRPTLFSYAGGRTGLMGEAGEEAIVPLRRGRDGKLGIASSGQSGPSFTFNIASGVSRNELAAMVPQLKAQIRAELQASMRRPGYLGA